MLPGVGLGRWPMPCADANGLLPGRGPAGRWPMPCADAKGLLPGRGAPPGRGGCGAASARAGGRGRRGRSGRQRQAAGAGAARGRPVPGGGGCRSGRSGCARPRPGRAQPERRARRRARRAGARGTGRDGPGRTPPGARSGAAARPPQPPALRGAVCLEGSAKLASHGGLDGGRGALDEFAELLQLGESHLAVDSEFGGDLVHAWFGVCHNSPVWGPPRQGRPLVADGTHFEPFTLFP